MISKSEIKLLRALHLQKYRRKQRFFLVEGTKGVLEFVQSPLPVDRIYATGNWLLEHEKELPPGQPVSEVSRAEMERISALKNPSEVLAVVRMPAHALPDLREVKGLVLALDQIRDPGNLGTIIRTADWFGIGHVVCSEGTVEAFNPKVVQATMGSLARVQVHYTDLKTWLPQRPPEIKIYGAMLEGRDIREVKPPKTGILLIGSEAHGISPVLYPLIEERIRIPGSPQRGAESLNAAVATAIVCYAFGVK